MVRRINKSQKAPRVSGFAQNSNNSKNASEKEEMKVRINEFTKSNELLEKQIELDTQKNKEEKLNAEKENELQMKSIETKYKDAICKVDGLAEKVKSAQQSNADLESKMRQLYENQSDELNVSKSRQEKELTCLKTKLGSLEAEKKNSSKETSNWLKTKRRAS